ncbi:efflux RND transporter periplasmic adaptor subunit [Opitutales bacterium ASA1]|uniref:efflux RND transporter periplasmic adaptor subunit n=1 Tax=Congregicoccus parvus TaxID=3081749 RepID=UPI002B2E10D5|nr:efflux RND transporter periplasmic adaptor subunit [Opitutales bacterium ASA1]
MKPAVFSLRLLLPIVVVAFASGCGRSTETASSVAVVDRTQRVRVEPVSWSDEAIPVSREGILTRRTESVLSFKIGGLVRDVRVRAGDAVRAGEVLATLDPAEIDAEVARAEAGVEKARRDLARAERLARQDVATIEQVEDARTALEIADSLLDSAAFNRRLAVVVAPADGSVLRRATEPDQLIGAGQPVLVFAAAAEPWIARVGISEHELAGLRAGSSAEVEIPNGVRVSGKLTHVSGSPEPTTRLYTVEVELDGASVADAPLRSGAIVRVRLSPDPVPARARVPVEALVAGDGDRALVYVFDAATETVRAMPVRIARLHADWAYLGEPLTPDTVVVANGAELLRDGQRVVVVP